MHLFSQYPDPGQYALRRRAERSDVPRPRALRYERPPQLSGKLALDRQDGLFREPLRYQWDLPAESARRCDRVRQTKLPDSYRGPNNSGPRARRVGPLQAWLCFLVNCETVPGAPP